MGYLYKNRESGCMQYNHTNKVTVTKIGYYSTNKKRKCMGYLYKNRDPAACNTIIQTKSHSLFLVRGYWQNDKHHYSLIIWYVIYVVARLKDYEKKNIKKYLSTPEV